MSTKPDDFGKWFYAQHGKRPSKFKLGELRDNYVQAQLDLEHARVVFQDTQDWDNREQSALYAWHARTPR
ncbi:MAG: hypothetical protein ACTS5I_13675 [Rhodanobacter sp.]